MANVLINQPTHALRFAKTGRSNSLPSLKFFARVHATAIKFIGRVIDARQRYSRAWISCERNVLGACSARKLLNGREKLQRKLTLVIQGESGLPSKLAAIVASLERFTATRRCNFRPRVQQNSKRHSALDYQSESTLPDATECSQPRTTKNSFAYNGPGDETIAASVGTPRKRGSRA